MAKSSKQFDKSKGILVSVVALLILVILALIVTYPRNQAAITNAVTGEFGKHVSLGSIQYDFSSGKAVKINDEKLVKLESFLNGMVKKDKELSQDCSSYYNVVAANQDNTQVLLEYGCSYPSANMFAVLQDNQWKVLSPTNNFDMLHIPLCRHVNDNGIAVSLAPVCFNEPKEAGSPLTYTVRV
ncbi:MAG: hypothetical protein UW38_C0001G0491 [Candidatus Saccharibacteria bacterium GW2011_GWC2_44_17]|nr:MAG: hypothetical protein UW38_C0001G0491 [Candidatus Saccharibacteria bacterium GW2011_GWC2_44_17]